MSDVMPVFVIKARDHLSVGTVETYRKLCDDLGLREQSKQVSRALAEILEWRSAHPDECKYPDHDHRPAGSPGSGSEVPASQDNQGQEANDGE